MALKSTASSPKAPAGSQTRRRSKAAPKPALALPHESDEPIRATALEPDPVILQAKRDLDAGLVDTDMHGTPGLDAELRAKLVPGAGGQAVSVLPTLADQKSDFTAEGAPPPGKVATRPPVHSTATDRPKR